MAALVDISPATELDFPTLAHIAAVATAVNLIHQVIHESNDLFDTSRQEQNIRAKLQGQAANPQARIFKATLKASGEIVGYAVFRFDDGEAQVAGGGGGGPSTANAPLAAKMNLLGRLSKWFEAAHSKHMGGKRHVFWVGLMVLPAHQRMGIGSAMLKHGLEELGADKVAVWLITQMNGHALYEKFGFEKVESIDVDLSEYTGPYRGFGVYRNICMVRRPGGLLGSEANT